MKKLLNSLQTKLTLSFILLILIVSGLAFFYTFGETKKALKEQMRNELRTAAAAVSPLIDAEAMAALKPGDESKPEYLAIAGKLLKVQKLNPTILFIYTMRKTGDGVEFVVDGNWGIPNEKGENDAAKIGQLYAEPPQEMLNGFERPSADTDFTTDQWGTVLSGYAPVMDAQGKSVGLIGIDMKSDEVIARQSFIGNTIYLIICIAVLAAGLMIFLFSRTIIRDIRKLNTAANAISLGDMSTPLDVKRDDEIGDLADSFGRMAASLKIMMMQQDADKKDKGPGVAR
jgi:HAMP domain-containing protein